MPISDRTHDPTRPDPAPIIAPRIPCPPHEVSLPARLRRLLTPPRISRAWPAAITLLTLTAFTIFWALTTLLVALIGVLATLVAGAVMLTLIYGTGRIARARRPADLRLHLR
jgi:hypothetical protein